VLTPTELTVLRNAKAGHVYRSERGHDLYDCYDRSQVTRGRHKKVTTIVKRLSSLGLLRIGEPSVMTRPWHVTEAGDKALAQTEGAS
jgi:hypothetical protein